ncbi:MAG: hypothetical protein ACE14S_12140 [Candidatus Bathyarchaeia archaeon]
MPNSSTLRQRCRTGNTGIAPGKATSTTGTRVPRGAVRWDNRHIRRLFFLMEQTYHIDPPWWPIVIILVSVWLLARAILWRRRS